VGDPPKRSSNLQPVRRGNRPTLELGRSKIGRYEVIYPIAQGGMAGVYAGRLPGMAGFEKLVALKVIHPYLTSEREFVEMFLDEARLAARVHHPNVAEIYEVGEDEGLYFMVGELVLGQHLRSVFRNAATRSVDIPHAMAAHIAAQAGRGLHSAHELEDQEGRPLKLVHRDMSLRNILVSYDGFVKLIDFGVAWAEGRIAQTKVGTVKGKIGFMSPEQILGEQLDRRSDIFSLGVVIYMMVTGNRPFPGESDAERMHKICTADPVPPRKINPRVSPELEGIILTALAKSREQRYPTAAVLSEELRAFVVSTGRDVSTKALSNLMHELFDEEISDHHEQLRSYRHQRPDAPFEGSSGLSAKVDSSPFAGPDTDEDRTSAARPSAKKLQQHGSRKRLGIVVAGAVLCIAALAAAAVLWATSNGGTDEPVQPEPEPSSTPAATAAAAPDTGAVTPETDEDRPIALPTAKIVVSLDISPQSARIALDGERLPAGTDRLELPADGASHEVEISAAGYLPARETVVADSDQQLRLRLKPKPAKSKPPTAKTGKMGDDMDLIHSPYR
jgi:serine/threonine-protein kinase